MIVATSTGVPHRTAFTNGAFEAVADVPAAKGGDGRGFGPHELLEAALATCLTMTVEMSAAKHAMPLTGARCTVTIDRTNPVAVALKYALEFDGPLSAEQVNHLRAAAAKCPVARTLTGSLTVAPEDAA